MSGTGGFVINGVSANDYSGSRTERPCSCVSRNIVRISCTVIRLVCLRRGMLPPDPFKDRQSAATSQAKTNRHTTRNCPGLSETRSNGRGGERPGRERDVIAPTDSAIITFNVGEDAEWPRRQTIYTKKCSPAWSIA